mmetsp:Transcript_21145/g.36300  ORF Transcript_21145/g.36300 Transcript_21145/m.36300 type:complete len:231 (-) Transcript_21145:456-1148(-)
MHAGLLTDGGDLGVADLVGPRNVVFQIDLVREVHLGRCDLEHQSLLPPVWHRELDLPVETAGPEKGRVERVGSVGGHDHLDVHRLVEAVHLVEQLQQDPLHLPVGARLRVEPLGRNGVNLVDEDDRRGVLPSQSEDVADHTRTFAEVLLHELGADDPDEGGGGVVRHSLGQHGLSRPWGSVEKDSAGRVDADLFVEVEVGEGQLDCLADLLLLDVESADVGVAHVGLLRR